MEYVSSNPSVKFDVRSIISIIETLLLDGSKGVRTSALELLTSLQSCNSVMDDVAEKIFRSIDSPNANHRLIAMGLVPCLFIFPTLNCHLSEAFSRLLSPLTDKDPVIRATAVGTLAVLLEKDGSTSSSTTIISQISPVIDLLDNSNTTSSVSALCDTAQIFIECVKYPVLHDIVTPVLPRFKEFLQSPSALVRSAGKKMIGNCAVYPSFHSSLLDIIHTVLLESKNQDQKLSVWLENYSNSEKLYRRISQVTIPKIIDEIKMPQYDVSNCQNVLALNKLASFTALESSCVLVLPKLVGNLRRYDPTLLLEVLNPDTIKYQFLHNLIAKHLRDANPSLVPALFLPQQYPLISSSTENEWIVKLVSRYEYLQTVLQKLIPQFVSRALGNERDFQILVTQLLENDILHESFLPTSPQLLNAFSSNTTAEGYHAESMSESRIGSPPQPFRYSRLPGPLTFECAILSHEAKVMRVDGRDTSLIMHQHIKQELLRQDNQKSKEKTAEYIRQLSSQAQLNNRKAAWRYLAISYSDKARSALSLSKARIEPAIQILIEFLKRPTLYHALKDCHVDDSNDPFSFPSFLKAELEANEENRDRSVMSAVWIYAIRDLVFLPHLHEDLIEILPMLLRGLLSDINSVPTSYKVATVILLGNIIQDGLLLSKLDNHPYRTITSGVIFELTSIMLREQNIHVRMSAVWICEILGRSKFSDNAYIHTLLTAYDIIPNLITMLSNAQESINIRYLVGKCLEVYSTRDDLHTPLTQTIPALLNLLESSITQNQNTTILPAVLFIIISYGRCEGLWPVIRDTVAYKFNISQREYTIYEPSSILCDNEFQKYTFLRQPFLDAIPPLLEVLQLDLTPYPELEKNFIDTNAKPEKSETIEETDQTLVQSVDLTPIQLCALNCVVELIKFPSLFVDPLSSSSSQKLYSALVTTYANILSGETKLVVVPNENRFPASDRLSKLWKMSSYEGNSEDQLKSDSDKVMVNPKLGTNSPKAIKDYQVAQKNEEQHGKKTTRKILLGPHPVLQYRAICALKTCSMISVLYPHILMALEGIVEGIDLAISATDTWIENDSESGDEFCDDGADDEEEVDERHRRSRMRCAYRMIDALCSFIAGSDPTGTRDVESALSFREILTSSLVDMLFAREAKHKSNGSVETDYLVRDVKPSRKVALVHILGVLIRRSMVLN